MINLDERQKIINTCAEMGHKVNTKDICFIILEKEFGDAIPAYKGIFDINSDNIEISFYKESKAISYLRDTMNKYLQKDIDSKKKSKYKDMTFEENKDALIQMLEEIDRSIEDGDLEKKDGLKMKADIRIKLNDKFGSSEKADDHRIIVNTKFNHICDYTQKECFLQTKEYAMKQWNLVEKEYINTI